MRNKYPHIDFMYVFIFIYRKLVSDFFKRDLNRFLVKYEGKILSDKTHFGHHSTGSIRLLAPWYPDNDLASESWRLRFGD